MLLPLHVVPGCSHCRSRGERLQQRPGRCPPLCTAAWRTAGPGDTELGSTPSAQTPPHCDFKNTSVHPSCQNRREEDGSDVTRLRRTGVWIILLLSCGKAWHLLYSDTVPMLTRVQYMLTLLNHSTLLKSGHWHRSHMNLTSFYIHFF